MKSVLGLIDDSASCTSLHITRGVADVISNKPFYIILADVSNKPVRIQKHLTVVHVTGNKALITTIETVLPKTDSETIVAVNYKTMVSRDTQTTRHKDVVAKGG